MNVKQKTILLVSLLFLLLSAAYFSLGARQANTALQEKIADLEARSEKELQAVIQNIFTPYSKRIVSFVNSRPDLIEAFAARDRALLLNRALPVYNALKQENPYFQTLPFILPEGINFLRVHEPDIFGDDQFAVRPFLRSVAETKTPHAAFDIGRHGVFYRIAQPVIHQGRFIGIVEFGIQAQQLLDTLAKSLEIPLAAYHPTDAWQKADLQQKTGMPCGKFTVMTEPGSLLAKLPAGDTLENAHQRVAIGDKVYIRHAHPIFKDHNGQEFGGIVALQDITPYLAQKRTYLTQSLLLTATLLGIAITILFAGFGGLVGRLENSEKMQGELVVQLEEKIALLKKQEAELKAYQENLQQLVKERTIALEHSLAEVKTLRGFLPICSYCKKIRNDNGEWERLEAYIRERSTAQFSHSICPECMQKHYPELQEKE